MKVAFHLRKSAAPASASAVLIESERVGPLHALLAWIGSDPAPPVHRVAGGFLVLLGDGPTRPRARPGSAAWPGTSPCRSTPTSSPLCSTTRPGRSGGIGGW